MIYRKLSPAGDLTFGKGSDSFYRNSPDTVAQAIKTRLALFVGEWFLDVTAGTFNFAAFGKGRIDQFNTLTRTAILETPGVTGIASFSSKTDPVTRKTTIAATVNTRYGQTSVATTL